MIGVIEHNLISRVHAAQQSNGGPWPYDLKKIGSWGRDGFDNDLYSLIRQFPAVWIIFKSAQFAKPTNQGTRCTVRFGICAAAQSLRNEEFARTKAAGSYQIIQDVAQLFVGQNLDLDIESIKLIAINSVVQDNSSQGLVSIYELTIETTFTMHVSQGTGLSNFTDFHANWDTPVTGDVGVTGLPDDANADATDHVTLPAASE